MKMTRPTSRVLTTLQILLATADRSKLGPDAVRDLNDATDFVDALQKNLIENPSGISLVPFNSLSWKPGKTP